MVTKSAMPTAFYRRGSLLEAGSRIEIHGYYIVHAYGILSGAVGTADIVAREFIPWW